MADNISFETPENVTVQYELAGLGSRFMAWLVDSILFALFFFFIVILLIIVGVGGESISHQLEKVFGKNFDRNVAEATMYFAGIAILLLGLGNFIYFTLSELLWAGQTIGKRQFQIRVVKADGFSLDATSIIIRNIFRIIDHIPAMWLVPLLSKKMQRLGDMVGGTIIVYEAPPAMNSLREDLLARPLGESKFRFDGTVLAKLSAEDFSTIEKLLERWESINKKQQHALASSLCKAFISRIGIDPLPATDYLQFLEELLAAEYRRQYRALGIPMTFVKKNQSQQT